MPVVEEVREVGEFPEHMGLMRLVHTSLVDLHQPTVNVVRRLMSLGEGRHVWSSNDTNA